MQFQRAFKDRIRTGELTVSLRKWKAPQVKIGGQYNLAPRGAIEVTGITTLSANHISTRLACACGFATAAELIRYLRAEPEDQLFRVDFHYLGDDPVNQPVTDLLSDLDAESMLKRLTATDAKSKHGPWAIRVLRLIGDQPACRAADLARTMAFDRDRLKANIRRLKKLGLTESLETGYRLTLRGQALLDNYLQS